MFARPESNLAGDQIGTTLVESTVILVCTGILLAVAMPNFHHLYQHWNLWGGARLVESSLQWGRMQAVSSNTSLSFIIDENGRRFYWMDGYTGERYEFSLRYLPGQVRIVSSPRRPLRFYQHGNAVPAGTFILEGEAGHYRVVVSPGGRIRIESY